jgi:hypothetical protein
LSFFTVLVIDGPRLSPHVFFLDWFYTSTIFAPVPATDVKDVGYVIVRFSSPCFHSFVDFRRIMTSRITARIISTASVALE